MDNPEITPKFELPFPPEITVEEVLGRTHAYLRSSRTPNCYIIYRLAYIKQLNKFVNTKNISAARISSYIRKSWDEETAKVKEEYRKLSEEVGNRLYQL